MVQRRPGLYSWRSSYRLSIAFILQDNSEYLFISRVAPDGVEYTNNVLRINMPGNQAHLITNNLFIKPLPIIRLKI